MRRWCDCLLSYLWEKLPYFRWYWCFSVSFCQSDAFWGEKVAVSQRRKCEVNKMCYIAFKRQEKSKHLSLWWHSNHCFSAKDLIFHSVTKSENLDHPWNKYLLHMQGNAAQFSPSSLFTPPGYVMCYVLAVAQLSCGSSSHTKVIGSIPDSRARRVRMSRQKSQQQISAGFTG